MNLLEQKYSCNSQAYEYLKSLTYGLWLPLECHNMDFGCVTLSWDSGIPDHSISITIKQYLDSVDHFIPLLYSACRSIITNDNLDRLWKSCSIILSTKSEASWYDRFASACTMLWGPDTTIYLGKPDPANNRIVIVAINGYQSSNEELDISKQYIPWGKGLLSYAITTKEPVISYSLPIDHRFEYHSMRVDGGIPGSAIATSLHGDSDQTPIAVVSVEHEHDGYFDDDDLIYLSGLAQIGYEAFSAHKRTAERLSSEFDTFITKIAHNIHEPLQALINDADVLRYITSMLSSVTGIDDMSKQLEDITHRASNILETCLDLSKEVRGYLDSGIDGYATKVIVGRVNLYSLLNLLVNTWEERASSHGVQLNPLFDSLRGVYVKCDEIELKSAFGHLIGNSIKYSFTGRRHSQSSPSKCGRYVNIIGQTGLGKAIIEFQNYGVGILKHEFNSVKEKFYRGELAIKEGRAGTGRGLWIASTFFESIGGMVEVNSEYKGSDLLMKEGPYLTTVKVSIPYILLEED